jgi:hypothetical protein
MQFLCLAQFYELNIEIIEMGFITHHAVKILFLFESYAWFCFDWHFFELVLLHMKKLAFIGLLAIACTSNKQVKLLDKELMDLHDEVMKHSSEILQLKDEINHLKETSISKDSLQQISFHLHKADQDMLEWMRHYQEPNQASDTAIAFYQAQIQYMKTLKEFTLQSIIEAKNILHEKK